MASVTPVPQVGFILSIKITIDPKNVEAFLGHFKPIYERCLAEPECVFFVIGQDPQEPGVFRWTEGWTKDAQWFMTQQLTKPYYKPYLEVTEPMFIKPREVEGYSPVKGFNHIKLDL